MSSKKDMDVRQQAIAARSRSFVSPDRFVHAQNRFENPKSPKLTPSSLDQSGLPKQAINPKKQSINRAPPLAAGKVNYPRQSQSVVLKRQSFRDKVQDYAEATFVLRSRRSIIITAVFLVLLAIGIFTILSIFRTKELVQPSAVPVKATSSLSEVEITISEITNHKVAADSPRVLIIPRLAVQAPIENLPPKSNGEPKDPDSIFKVGWDNDSAKPNQPGAVLLSGHVSGATKSGVFANLGSLQIGDSIKLERGDYETISYLVVASQIFDHDKVNMVSALNPFAGSEKGLNLLSATGKFDVKSNNFEKRVLVFAVQQ